jgi:hypothetical protein
MARAILMRVKRLEAAIKPAAPPFLQPPRFEGIMQRLAAHPDLFREFAALCLAPSMEGAARLAEKMERATGP